LPTRRLTHALIGEHEATRFVPVAARQSGWLEVPAEIGRSGWQKAAGRPAR